MIRDLIHFFRDGVRNAATGGRRFHLWMAFLALLMGSGALAYSDQFRHGLVVTGMNDIVSWGLYISNFTFLVGMAAAAVMLVLPTYILHDVDFRKAVLVGEGVAVAALLMCLSFVMVDVGGPMRLWHMIPMLGYFNWPESMLTWDTLVLNGYLALNSLIPFYLLFKHWKGEQPDKRKYVPFVVLSVMWAVCIHLVTAFLYAGLVARPFWNNALLGPRFLASAFAAGPSFILLVLAVVRHNTAYEIKEGTLQKLSIIVTVAAQINLVMLGSELFKEFYHVSEHSASAVYLFFGLHGHSALVPWIWTAISMNILATLVLTINPLRRKLPVLYAAAATLFVAIWIEKGMGLIVPGLIPSPLGEMTDYHPSWTEIRVTLGIWGMGLTVLTVLIKAAIPIELGSCRRSGAHGSPSQQDDHHA